MVNLPDLGFRRMVTAFLSPRGWLMESKIWRNVYQTLEGRAQIPKDTMTHIAQQSRMKLLDASEMNRSLAPIDTFDSQRRPRKFFRCAWRGPLVVDDDPESGSLPSVGNGRGSVWLAGCFHRCHLSPHGPCPFIARKSSTFSATWN
jgi:hypothetical protein